MPTKKRKQPKCKDCPPNSKRRAPHPGPRCATHHREVKVARGTAAHERHIADTYNMTPDDYKALYEYQGRKCAVCRTATGARRRLSVDHDHACCRGATSCGKCVRALVCRGCNDMFGRLRDNPATFRLAAAYLEYPPRQRMVEGEPWPPSQPSPA